MEVLHPRCAGLDVHKDTVVACVRLAEGGRVERHIETFATTTSDLERLSAWLADHGVTHVAMEATGVYWKPVWAVLCEGDLALVLANARFDSYTESGRDGRPRLSLDHHPPHQVGSTMRRQPGILMNVHPVLRGDPEASQLQPPRSEPDGQPDESSS